MPVCALVKTNLTPISVTIFTLVAERDIEVSERLQHEHSTGLNALVAIASQIKDSWLEQVVPLV